MECKHRAVLVEWDGEAVYRAGCQVCLKAFHVVWVDHSDGGPENDWAPGRLTGIELYERVD